VDDPSVNRKVIQAAIDRAGNSGNWLGEPGLVTFGPGTWTIDGPIFLDKWSGPFSKVGLRGVSRELSRIKMQPYNSKDVVVIGMDRAPYLGTEAGLPLDPAHFPRSDDFLDATAAGHRAFRTRTVSTEGWSGVTLTQSGGVFDQGPGDWYGKARRLTFDYAVIFHDGAASNGAQVWGLADYGSWPIVVEQSNSRPTVGISTVGPDPSDPESVTTRYFALDPDAVAPTGVPIRYTLQLDLDTPTMLAAWVDGKRVPVRVQSGPPTKAGESLFANRSAPWMFGGYRTSGGALWDESLLGFKVVAEALYDPAKDVLTRKDGRPIDDRTRYFADEPGWFGLLKLEASGEDVARDRVVECRGRESQGTISLGNAWAADPSLANPWSIATPGPIEDIAIQGGGSWYGNAILYTSMHDARFRNIDARAGAHGMGGLMTGASYPLDIDGGRFGGRHSPLYLIMTSSASARDIYLTDAYRYGVQLAYGGISIRKLISPHFGAPEYGFFVAQGTIRLEQVALDSEDPAGGSQIADVYVTPMIANQPSSANVIIDDMDGVISGPRSSKVLLGGPPKGSAARTQVGACSVRISGLAIHSEMPFRSVVRCIAEDLWADGGISTLGDYKAPMFEGFPLLKAKVAVTNKKVVVPAARPR
jgi:hypothetical protein